MSQAASITVAVRVRPPTSWEVDRLPEPAAFHDTSFCGDGRLSGSPRKLIVTKTLRPIVQVMDEKVLVFDPKDMDVSRAFEQRGFLPPGTKRYKDQRYTFDRVFDESAQQVDVFEETTKPLLDGLLNGFNATVFAYGATGCGKTHTISGTESDPGIIYLTMAELFNKIEEKKDDLVVDITLSFLEIYNEEIRDLLADPDSQTRGGLAMREDKNTRIVVTNLTERKPTTADEVKEMVLAGNLRRTQSPTHANATSSRSHAVLQINVGQTPRTASTTEERTMATLSIIDLAGSERASATKNMGDRMVEGANINKSLLALGNCINALCESGNRTRHVPYRNSKLTRLLKFSLGGNCKTVMIVCVAPTSVHYEDTQNTLKYANRAKDIKTKVSRNFINVNRHVAQYVEAISRLNDEVAELKAKLAGRIASEGDVQKRKKAEAKAEMDRLKADLQTKADQTKPIVIEGATCEGTLVAAQSRLSAIHARLGVLESQADDGVLSSDLQAERGLLQSLAASDEAIVRSGSTTHQRLNRANNANSMFDATLRAATERRSDRLDDICVDNVKTDAKLRRAELDQVRLQTRGDVLKDAVGHQAGMITTLVGILARCTVMMNDGGDMLGKALDEAELTSSEASEAIKNVASQLAKVAASNDESFQSLVGQSTTTFVTGTAPSSLINFAAHPAGRRSVSAPVPTTVAAIRNRRRSSVALTAASPARRHHKSPRKPSLRSSLAQPVFAKPDELALRKPEKKSLRWKDQAGEGSIDDAGRGGSVFLGITASKSGNEADWEDEKTEESFSVATSIAKQDEHSTPIPIFSLPSSSATSSAKPSILTAPPTRKTRSSRMDPGFLKSQSTNLDSLTEVDDESLKSPTKGSSSRAPPLGERSNQPLPSANLDEEDPFVKSPPRSASTSPVEQITTPPRPGPYSVKRIPGSASKRRKSNMGPYRAEKLRRRSSLIPQLSPRDTSTSSTSLSSSTMGAKSSTMAALGPPRRAFDPDLSVRRSPAKKTRRTSSGRLSVGSVASGTSITGRAWRPRTSVLRMAPIVPPAAPMGTSSVDAAGKRTWR